MPGRPASDDEDCELFFPIETHLAVHHILHLRALQETSETPNGRLITLMPPGSAKTTYGSVVFPSWYLGKNRGSGLILTSYGDDLARKMGRKTRSIIRQPRYRRIFDTGLSGESQAADQFLLENGSAYMASSLFGGITGNRTRGAMVDDPVKGREAAKSELKRQATWEAFQDDLLTRLIPGGWLAITMTRWDEDDLGGRILPADWNGESGVFEGRDGMAWRVLCLQARCETHTDPLGRKIGEYLWPEWFGPDHWPQFERNKITWASLFQQRPSPLEGVFFTEDYLLVDGKPVEIPQLVDYVYAVIDTAMKTGKKRDGTGVTFFARSKIQAFAAPITILDWDLKQMNAAVLVTWLPLVYKRLEELATACKARYGSIGAFIEDKSSGTVLIQQAQTKEWPAHAIDSGLSAMGKNERGLNASSYVFAGDVKITREAYEKVVEYHGATRNHLLKQFTGFDPNVADMGEDDMFDTLCYGVAIGMGNDQGF